MYYGNMPEPLGLVHTEASEMCFVQYLPIVLPGEGARIPDNLQWCVPIVRKVLMNVDVSDKYVYLTAKHLFVTPDNVGNRAGWHSDGFMTDDINFIWYDKHPTEFCVQRFNITEDCDISMREMESQAKEESIVVYPDNLLLKLDSSVIHRPPANVEPGYRTFVKVSISKDKYNLKGNAHNYLFNYDWDMVERDFSRNHPSKGENK